MRIIVFFDLPTLTSSDMRNYRNFRNFLLKSGFIMMQKSVYSKIVLNASVGNLLKDKIKKACPKSGIVQMLTVTEKQFSNIELLLGSTQDTVIDSDKRLIIL